MVKRLRQVCFATAFFGKGQLLWKPNAQWSARVLVGGERARDGDYALNDLGALRARPFHASRSIEGFTHRDVASRTVDVGYSGGKCAWLHHS